jgi:NADH dehydrogenase FAD-containing subunit
MAAPNIFVIGDSADTTYSGWAQTAVYDAEFLAHNWLLDVEGGKTRRYQPPRPLVAIPLDPKWCGLAANSRRLYGNAACLIRSWHDRSLLGTVLPTELATTVWRNRQSRDETCPVCAASRPSD